MAPAAGEALKHFVFVVPEGATAEDEKKDTEILLDVPIMPTLKVQGPGWMGAWWQGRMEKDRCGRAAKARWGPGSAGISLVCPRET